MTMTMTNSRPERKQLGDQLDRLDSILDGLSEALSEAVADATREGVRHAVKEAVVELLTNPDLRVTLHQASAPNRAPTLSFWQKVKQRVLKTTRRVANAARSLVAAGRRRVVSLTRFVAGRIALRRGLSVASCLVRVTLIAAAAVSLARRGLVSHIERLCFAAMTLLRRAMLGMKVWRGPRLRPQAA